MQLTNAMCVCGIRCAAWLPVRRRPPADAAQRAKALWGSGVSAGGNRSPGGFGGFAAHSHKPPGFASVPTCATPGKGAAVFGHAGAGAREHCGVFGQGVRGTTGPEARGGTGGFGAAVRRSMGADSTVEAEVDRAGDRTCVWLWQRENGVLVWSCLLPCVRMRMVASGFVWCQRTCEQTKNKRAERTHERTHGRPSRENVFTSFDSLWGGSKYYRGPNA